MSYENDLQKRIITAQNSLQQLKATQIIGGDNLEYHFYKLPSIQDSLQEFLYKDYEIIFYANKPFPLVSVEMDIFEKDNLGNWKQILNPQGNTAIPYNGVKDSQLSYIFLDTTQIINFSWGGIEFDIRGKTYNVLDPRLYLFHIEVEGTRADAYKEYKFDNIKIRSSSSGEVFFEKVEGF